MSLRSVFLGLAGMGMLAGGTEFADMFLLAAALTN